ncbi:hypothetical protein BGZ60DRAFT_480747 [Tricladium varicosporioides]|nr:hypothetical protein BGZ60DRAFT_480747 [Hymenoscyphus varicosporioides]
MHPIFVQDPSNPRIFVQVTLCLVFLCLNWITVGLRFYTRRCIIKSLSWDDHFMLLAQVMYTGFCITIFLFKSYVSGRVPDSMSSASGSITCLIINELFYALTTIFLKLSLGIFFLRFIFSVALRRFIYSVMAITTVMNILMVFFDIFQCGLPGDYLNKFLAWKCAPIIVGLALAEIQAAVSAGSDLSLAVVAVYTLIQSSMDMRSKFSVGGLLLLATIGCLASFWRFFYIPGLFNSKDFYWASGNIGIWTTVEVGVSILAGCLATLRPLFRQVIGRVESSSYSEGFKGEIVSPSVKRCRSRGLELSQIDS